MTSVNNRPLSPMKTPFRRKNAPDSLQILRSRSLDYSGSEKRSLDYSSEKSTSEHEHYEDIASAATSLNSSFDAALGEESKTIFRAPTGKGGVVTAAASWDATGGGELLVGRKHLNTDIAEESQPIGTVRKQPRRSSSTMFADTPCRSGTTTAMYRPTVRLPAQPTPGSSSRRRKATPLENRKVKSPYQHNYSFGEEISPHATPLFLPQLYKAVSKQPNTCNTATTAHSSSLDLTCDTSHESPVSTPFRFTSFPASLPRVNPRASQFDTPFDSSRQLCPQTTRKKMNFSSAALGQSDASVLKRARPMDETAQTSSLSSMSGEQQQLYPACSSTFEPPSTLELTGNTNNVARRIDTNFSDDSDAPEPRQVMPSGNLFLKGYSYDEEEEESSNIVNVSRTRLDFNVAVSPKEEGNSDTNKHDDSSPTKPIHRTLEYPELETFADVGSPARMPEDTAMITNERAVSSPAEAQFLSRLDAAQCSPILPYNYNNDVVIDNTTPPERLLSPVNESTTKELSVSRSDESTSSSKQRRLRPMPDMSAFEGGGASVRSGSSSHNNNNNKSDESPLKLTCPPTPVRTPAWAHNNNKNTSNDDAGGNPFLRSDSLIVTKVLATAAAEPHSSLEDSNSAVMDDTSDEIEKRKISLSFSTVDEDEEMQESSSTTDTAPPQVSFPQQEVVSFTKDFENLGTLGKGSFADVYKVRSKLDHELYAVKRNRRQFRGKRDRDMAMAEVRIMQKLQVGDSLYILSFHRAWQEEGYFYCQTALCCRDTCRELIESLRCNWSQSVKRYPSLINHFSNDAPSEGQATPESTIWKICHDVAAGLSHIHSHNIVHHDIKPDNIFFVSHPRLGAICKIGDFGMAGEVGTADDGQEGDTVYMPLELLSSSVKHFSSDIFSLGLTLYELASPIGWEMPAEGPRWHELRDGKHIPELASGRQEPNNSNLLTLIQACIGTKENRPTAKTILAQQKTNPGCKEFLRDYIRDVEAFDVTQEENHRNRTPRTSSARDLKTPSPAGILFTDN